MIRRALQRLALPTAIALAVAVVQLTFFVHDKPASGSWFLYGSDTVSHDAPVQWWAWQALHESWVRGGPIGGELPLWLPQLQGGLPTLGAFLWTPGAPSLWLHAVLPFAWAQWAQFVFALAWGGLGAWFLARRMRLSIEAALVLAVGWGLCGHVTTLIHAGHLQKVLALAWLPWGAAGVAIMLTAQGQAAGGHGWWRGSARGAALAGGTLGTMLLAGHPQIAALYMAFLLCSTCYYFVANDKNQKSPREESTAIEGIASSSHPVVPALLLIAPIALGFLIGGLQLLPGIEMAALGNRSGGVAWAEAVETSYPPAELIEWFLPRAFGDSSAAGWGVYTGAWGQRLVSDYAGMGIVALAIVGLGLSRRREKWLWGAFGAACIVVGLGKHAPVYALLYEFAPGFRSFRSPATFFAGAALALPVLAAMGVEALRGRIDGAAVHRVRLAAIGVCVIVSIPAAVALVQAASPMPRAISHAALFAALGGFAVVVHRRALVALPIVIGLDLMSANSAFLRAVPWDDYAAYAAPNDVDLAMIDEPAPRRVWEPGRELSLRPLFVERDALLGYHPISYRAFADHLHATGAGSPAWRAQWGVAWRLDGERLVRDAEIAPPLRALQSDARIEAQWLRRTPNDGILDVRINRPLTLELAETIGPGWRWRVGEGAWQHATAVELTRRVELPAGSSIIEWQYRPTSFRLGLWATAIGIALLAAVVVATMRRDDERASLTDS